MTYIPTFVYLTGKPSINSGVVRLCGDAVPPPTNTSRPKWTGAAASTMLTLSTSHIIGFTLRDDIHAYGLDGISGVTIYTALPNLSAVVMFVEPEGSTDEDDPRDRCDAFVSLLTEEMYR